MLPVDFSQHKLLCVEENLLQQGSLKVSSYSWFVSKEACDWPSEKRISTLLYMFSLRGAIGDLITSLHGRLESNYGACFFAHLGLKPDHQISYWIFATAVITKHIS